MNDSVVFFPESDMNPFARDLADEYIELCRSGDNPPAEEFLAQNPAFEEELRPVVEGAALFSELVRRFKVEHPGLGVLDLLAPRSRPLS